MSVMTAFSSTRKTLSLTLRVSLLLVLAVVLPLIITVVGSALILRPTLTSQAIAEMELSAQSRTQAIDSLFVARLQDISTLSQYAAIQQFLHGNAIYREQAIKVLELGQQLDEDYSAWAIFDAEGKNLLSYPGSPTPRGTYTDTIPGPLMDQLTATRQPLISDVSFDVNTRIAFVDIYSPIYASDDRLLGIGRSTFNLTDIWDAVNNEAQAAPGSYAMIIDKQGVRVAYTNTNPTSTTLPDLLFTGTGAFEIDFQARIHDENLYNDANTRVKVVADQTLYNGPEQTSFQYTPPQQEEGFQTYQAQFQIVPWTFIILRPVSTITQAANQQDIYLFAIAAAITILAAIVGLLVGRGITRPILRSVTLLTKNSEMLKVLAAREQATATEQKWIVESSQSGLKSVQYYAEASSQAARKLNEIGQGLSQNQARLDNQKVKHYLQEIITTAAYLEKAATYQERSSKSLSTAIRVTTQVTEQLLEGATSASEAATQLEDVITQLRRVVGE